MEKTDVQHQVHLDSTASLLAGDLQEESTKAGLDNILQRWIEDVKEADNPELHQIVIDLQQLKAHLGSGTYDNRLIGQLLGRLGENTIKSAVFATGNTQPRVESLGEALLKAAKAIQSPGSAPEDDLKNSNQAS
ncbi:MULTISPECIES: hypothetical protein [Hymenobacter]|uniref:Uncharacterized protein n=1 Tax=Hymenobacter jejuensis TaxID=2502781 RepID=A0A5B8A1H4_9BACT|nr:MULTISPECIES: hypothetical protein [Hymenobacter]MBC6990620.1 hypothetical protein [Hymenobacter sp. BT491]QDA60967.1 hypothetical protein FHG12_13015 [Hymenobacter jejuensis]